MSTKNDSSSSEGTAGYGPLIDRRRFVVGTVGTLLISPLWSEFAAGREGSLSGPARTAFENSRYVYISPLRSNGGESRCHGEVWFAWLEDSVLVTSRAETWKVRSISKGLDRARVWVGDYGRWKKGKNESFREGANFETQSTLVEDPALVSEVLNVFDNKYPEEFPKWKDRMAKGHRERTRLLLRYELVLNP